MNIMAMFGETDYRGADTIQDVIRSVFAVFDKMAYWLLGIMYQLFFNVASADLFKTETVVHFYSRMQLIIGVFMVFKLAVTIIQGIVNPDTFTDKKTGFGSFITRVVFALVMLTVLQPINIPNAKTEYEIQINNNGLLFGTLYSLQDRLLENNTLGRLILGTTDNATSSDDETDEDDYVTGADKQGERLEKAANIFTGTILRGFIRINMLPEEARPKPEEGETANENRMCQNISDNTLKIYTDLESDPGALLSLVTKDCTSEEGGLMGFVDGLIETGKDLINLLPFVELEENDIYVFNYTPIISTVTALVFAFVLILFTVDIAIRAIKLAVLRLLAPIPIISYIDPKSSAKDGTFTAWVSTLTSTYLDLFIRLAIIYMVIFLIQDMIVNGIVVNNGSGPIGIFTFIFICLGLFLFARQAPKFIKDVLGLKGHMSNVGLSAMLGGAAMVAGGGGLRGAALGAMQGVEGEIQGYNQGKPQPLGAAWSQNRDLMAKIRTGDKDARGGIIGATMDRLNYETRERNADRLGIGSKRFAAADYLSKVRQAEAAQTQAAFDLAKIKYQKGEISEAEYRAAEQKNDAYQAEAKKAAKAYEAMDKDRALLGATPRVMDKRERQYGARRWINDNFGEGTVLSGTYRSPLKTTNNPYAEDQQNISGGPRNDEEILGQVNSYQQDLKGFNGTADDETVVRR